MTDVESALKILTRGVEAIYSLDELRKKLTSGKRLRIKLGLDPSKPDIHLGHTVVLRKLRQFQDLGHMAVLIIGDYTVRIGDPTGRDTTRPILEDATIQANARTYFEQAGRVLDTTPGKLEVRYNSEWLSKLNFADVLRLTGMATVQQMLHREDFKNRIAQGREISLSEFMYPIMQAYDSVVIQSDVELGGTDQTFNTLMGREMMAKSGMERQVVMLMPILVGLDGREKMSKSLGNYVGVTEAAGEMFGKIMSIPDVLMPNYYQLLTDLPAERINSLVDAKTTHPREAKDALGRVLVEIFHDRPAAEKASREFRLRFSDKELPAEMETKTITHTVDGIIGVLDLVRQTGFASSNSEARRLVEQGAVSLDGQKIVDPKSHLAIQGQPVLRVGRLKICRIKLE